MKGDYDIKIRPRGKNWKDATILDAEIIIDIEGEKRVFKGVLKQKR